MVVSYPVVDIQSQDPERHRRNMAEAINSLRQGKVNSSIDVTLDVSPAETTTFSHPFLGAVSRVILTPGMR